MGSNRKMRGATSVALRASLRNRREGVGLKALALLAATAVVVAATYLLRPDPSPPVEQRPSNRGADVAAVTSVGATSQAPTRSSGAETDRLIRAYERRAKEHPNVTEYVFLGRLYLDEARLTGDASVYLQAKSALRKAVGIAPADFEARTLLANARFATHEFPEALRLASAVVKEDPDQLGALAIVGDSYLEIGRYKQAGAIYRQLASELPGAAAVQVRRARLAFLEGDIDRARRLAHAAQRSARSSGAFGAGLAWFGAVRAQMELDSGNYDAAATLYEAALRIAPGYHVTMAGLARARGAQGRDAEAIRWYRKAIAIVPQPDYVAALGDLYELQGRRELAGRQYATVEAIATLARANQQVFNRQLAMFYADHDVKVVESLRLAESEMSVRRDVYGLDAYAWSLYRNGQYNEARAAADEARQLGTRDARLLYHSGLIYAAQGLDDRAEVDLRRALSISPNFDPLQAKRARRALSKLERVR